MRELKRSIARHLMEMHGQRQINKRRFDAPARKPGRGPIHPGVGRKVSFFAMHWKDYLNPESVYRKDLEKNLKRQAARRAAASGNPAFACL